MDPVSAGLGAATLISGKGANKKAQRASDKAGAYAKELEKRAVKLYDLLLANAEKADLSGAFDPEKRIAALEKDTARYESRDSGNLGGALASAGYKVGDSEIGVRLDAVKSKYRNFLDTMRDQIRQQAFFDKQAAYSSANPGMLNAAIGGARGEQQNALARLQNPSGFLGSFLPTLAGGAGRGGNAGQAGQAGFFLGNNPSKFGVFGR